MKQPVHVEVVPEGFAFLDENENGEMQVFEVSTGTPIVSKGTAYITQTDCETLMSTFDKVENVVSLGA